MSLCEACGGVPHQWVISDSGTFSVVACPACPKPRATDALHAVLGAVLYDDGDLQHWERARDLLLTLDPPSSLPRALIGWMRFVAESGQAPSNVNIAITMGPKRCTPLFGWFMRHLMNESVHAKFFDAALVAVVRQRNAKGTEGAA